MRVNQYKLLHNYLVIADLLAMAFSFLVATSMVVSEVDGIPLTEFLSIRISILNFIIFIGFTFSWYITLALSGAYYVRRLSKSKKEIKNIIQITSFGTIILLVFKVIFSLKLVTLSFLLVFWLMTTMLAIFSRMAIRFIIKKSWANGLNLQNVVIVGTNKRAVEFARNLEQSPELGYRVMGFVDQEWQGNPEFQKSGYPLLADFKNFPASCGPMRWMKLLLICPSILSIKKPPTSSGSACSRGSWCGFCPTVSICCST